MPSLPLYFVNGLILCKAAREFDESPLASSMMLVDDCWPGFVRLTYGVFSRMT